jgi:hypothetical protein
MTQNEWQEWIQHPVTSEFFAHLKKAKQETMEGWANRQYTTEGDNQFALGGIYAVNQILELDYEDIKGA